MLIYFVWGVLWAKNQYFACTADACVADYGVWAGFILLAVQCLSGHPIVPWESGRNSNVPFCRDDSYVRGGCFGWMVVAIFYLSGCSNCRRAAFYPETGFIIGLPLSYSCVLGLVLHCCIERFYVLTLHII